MSILLICMVAVGFTFTPPTGWRISTVRAAPDKQTNLVTTGTITWGTTSPAPRLPLEILLTPEGKVEGEVVLPQGCTGESTGVKFKAQ